MSPSRGNPSFKLTNALYKLHILFSFFFFSVQCVGQFAMAVSQDFYGLNMVLASIVSCKSFKIDNKIDC